MSWHSPIKDANVCLQRADCKWAFKTCVWIIFMLRRMDICTIFTGTLLCSLAQIFFLEWGFRSKESVRIPSYKGTQIIFEQVLSLGCVFVHIKHWSPPSYFNLAELFSTSIYFRNKITIFRFSDSWWDASFGGLVLRARRWKLVIVNSQLWRCWA